MAMAVLGALGTANVAALGLGDIDLKSALNQPLDAEVQLLSATGAEMQELKVSIAPPEAFQAAGIDRPMFLNKLKFDVRNNSQGKPVIHITSKDVIREPFLDFLLEISWSKGQLVREYTVLVDPPVTMPAAPAVARAPASSAAPAVQPAYHVTHTAQMPPVAVAPGEYGPTRRNDTLWKVAEQVRPDKGVSMEQTMLALLRANPEAFVGNNINNLKAGYVLRVPGREEMLSISRAEARREARAQYAAWREERGLATPAGAQATPTVAAAGTAAEAPAHLKLVAPEEAEAGAAGGGEQAADLDRLQQELMVANEALEAQQRQSEEMSQRLSMLEEQIVNMKRLIELKDDELARLQAGVNSEAGATEANTPAPASAEEPAAVAANEATAPTPESAEEGVPEGALAPQADAAGAGDQTVVAGEAVAETEASTTQAASPEEGATVGETAPATEAAAESGSGIAGGSTGDAELDQELQALENEDGGQGEPTAAASEDSVPGEAAPAPAPAPVAETPPAPQTATPPGFVDRLLENPLWLGAGGVVLALLAFFGLRRKRGVETEFQESILQAAGRESSTGEASDSEIVAAEPESRQTASTESSLLSEFAVSDMGSIRNDGEADPLAEADVYLAYGRFQQAEELIKDALEKEPGREDLNLKLLEIYLAGRNQSAFDAHAQEILAKLENSEDPLWQKVADMGRELSPDNPMYQEGGQVEGLGGEDGEVSGVDELEAGLDFDLGEGTAAEAAPEKAAEEPAAEPRAEEPAEPDLDFDLNLSFDENAAQAQEEEAPGVEEQGAAGKEGEPSEPKLDIDMDQLEPDTVQQDNALEFDLDSFDIEGEEAAEEEEAGDGQLADLDEVSTKLDLARAYIDMGDPDGAQSILDEVMAEGSEEQKEEARSIMEQIA
ncbi:MAG TPA: hypothetical protein ENK05_05890 [Gammaproteobacteria bacterium]|nr:hypothetical protein [Gammaproteobacteria bacterium]